VPALSYLSTLLKPQVRQPPKMEGSPHLMLRGINETIFLGQWGIPENKISLNDLKAFFILDFLTVSIETAENEYVAVWIYGKKDMILFFKEEKLISHFKWSQFKTRFRRPDHRGFESHGTPLENGPLTGRDSCKSEDRRLTSEC
jgi:hypothetical protein